MNEEELTKVLYIVYLKLHKIHYLSESLPREKLLYSLLKIHKRGSCIIHKHMTTEKLSKKRKSFYLFNEAHSIRQEL